MKRLIYIIAFSLICLVSAQAQIDRSVQPKPGPAPKINLGKPKSFQLPNGLTVMVVENHKLPRVSFSLSLDNPPLVEGDIVGVADLTNSMLGSGTSKMSKEEFNSRIEYYGASVYFSAGYVGGSTLSRYFPEVISLAAQGTLDPLFTQNDLDSERAKALDGLKAMEKSAQSIAPRVYRTLVYGKNHPKGEVTTEESLKKVTLNDVKNFYSSYCVPANAYLVVVGDVKFDDVKKLVTENFSGWKKAEAPTSVYIDPVNLSATEINFVDLPNAVQSEIYAVNVTDLKMTDPDYFAAFLANQILGGGGEGRLFLNLREAHGWTYGSYSTISGSKYVSTFAATASVRNAVTDSAVVEMMNELTRIRTTLPTQEELDLAKAKYVGKFVMNAEKPATIANFALTEKTQSLPADFYENYIKNLNAVTLQQVQAAARKYILDQGTRFVIVGKASETLDGLEKLNIPIKYYDMYGNPASKPEKQEVAAGVTAQTVLQKYIDAIGGEAAAKNVKTMMVTAKASVQGQEITMIQKSTVDGKSFQETSMMGMVMSKVVFDGQKGYMEMQGQRQDLPQEQINEMKNSSPIPELSYMTNPDVKLTGIENGAYILKLGKKSMYYDVQTGLKTAEGATVEIAPGQEMTQMATLGDYREVSGVKVPYKTTMNVGMEIEMNVTDVKINEGVTDADFQ